MQGSTNEESCSEQDDFINYLRLNGVSQENINKILNAGISTMHALSGTEPTDLVSEAGVKITLARALINSVKTKLQSTETKTETVTGLKVTGGSVTVGDGGVAGVNYGNIYN